MISHFSTGRNISDKQMLQMQPRLGQTAAQVYGHITDTLMQFSEGMTLQQFIKSFSLEVVYRLSTVGHLYGHYKDQNQNNQYMSLTNTSSPEAWNTTSYGDVHQPSRRRSGNLRAISIVHPTNDIISPVRSI